MNSKERLILFPPNPYEMLVLNYDRLSLGMSAVAEPDQKIWGGRYQNKQKYINHFVYNTFKL